MICKRIAFIFFAFVFVSCHGATNAAPARTDARTPARIISLKPNITEILFALGVGDKVVGVTTWCDYPEAAKKLPKIADYININTEKLLTLKPDLIIGSEENSIRNQFSVFDNAGIRTLTLPFRTMDDLYGSIEKIAEAVGKKDTGLEMIKRMTSQIQSRRNPGTQERVLVLVGHRPLVAAGDSTFYGDIMKVMGVKNVVKSRTPYPTINTEFIMAKDPDVIIDLAMGTENGSDLPDVIKRKIVTLNMSDFRAGPRIGEAVKELATKLK